MSGWKQLICLAHLICKIVETKLDIPRCDGLCNEAEGICLELEASLDEFPEEAEIELSMSSEFAEWEDEDETSDAEMEVLALESEDATELFELLGLDPEELGEAFEEHWEHVMPYPLLLQIQELCAFLQKLHADSEVLAFLKQEISSLQEEADPDCLLLCQEYSSPQALCQKLHEEAVVQWLYIADHLCGISTRHSGGESHKDCVREAIAELLRAREEDRFSLPSRIGQAVAVVHPRVREIADSLSDAGDVEFEFFDESGTALNALTVASMLGVAVEALHNCY